MIWLKLMFEVYDFLYDFFVARVTLGKNLVNVTLFSLCDILMLSILLLQLRIFRCTILFLICKRALWWLLYDRLDKILYFIIFGLFCSAVMIDNIVILDTGHNNFTITQHTHSILHIERIFLKIGQFLAFRPLAFLPDKFFNHIQPVIYG